MKRTKMKLWQKILLFGALLLLSQQIFSQVKGKVSDINGAPITGVTIIEKGTNNGVLSGADGSYVINLKSMQNAVLVFSFIGFESQEISIRTLTQINVTMVQSAIGLEEVVVVGYGVQKKVSVTGSVASVLTADLKQSPAPNIVSALTGRLSGLITIQNSGQPGKENFNIFLRGASTTNGQNPLILIDGVPRDNITSLDPDEIASISILKDASSTAVFGVRGANGVILITSKRGTAEVPVISASFQYGLQDFTSRYRSVDSWDFARLRNQALNNDGKPSYYSDSAIEKYKNGSDPWLYPNTDWYKLMVRDYTPISRYNVNISGGTDIVKYFINTGIIHQGGMFKTEPESQLGYDPQYKMDRYNFRTNLDINISSWIKSSVDLAGYIERVNGPGSVSSSSDPTYIVLGFISLPPTMPGPVTIEGYGVPAGFPTYNGANNASSYHYLNRTGFVLEERSILNSALAFDFDLKSITKGLSAKVKGSFDSRSTSTTKDITNSQRYNFIINQVPDLINGGMKDTIYFQGLNYVQYSPFTLSKAVNFLYKINMQFMLNYSRIFGNKHQVTGLFLVQRDNNEAASGASDLLLPYNVLGISGRVAYDYDNRYMIEFNAGYNGSEQFARDRRFGFFPAASVGWVVSNERFMKSQNVINNLKFRASYGKVGNDQLGNARFLYLDNISVTTGGWSPSLGLGKYVNYNLIGNPELTWETSYKQNYGIELTILKDLSFTGDVYFEKRDHILISSGLTPSIQGIPLTVIPKTNVGKVNNEGFELDLNYKKSINKDLYFTIGANYNFNKNTVINLDEPPYDDSYAYRYRRTGYSLSQNFGYLIDWQSAGNGYFTSAEEIAASGLTFTGVQPVPGDFVYKDLNGDKIINEKDQAPIKYGTIPRITYGINFTLSYKGFDLSALFQGITQTSQYYSSWGIWENMGPSGSLAPISLNAWTKELYEAGEKITYPRLTTTGSSSQAPNDFFIMDRSYLRLKNAEIGFTIPASLIKRIGIRKIRLYCNGQNILTWDKLPMKNFDPEVTGALTVPMNRIVNLGLNVTF